MNRNEKRKRKRKTLHCAIVKEIREAMDVEGEVNHLVKEIERLGTKGPDGKAVVKYP